MIQTTTVGHPLSPVQSSCLTSFTTLRIHGIIRACSWAKTRRCVVPSLPPTTRSGQASSIHTPLKGPSHSTVTSDHLGVHIFSLSETDSCAADSVPISLDSTWLGLIPTRFVFMYHGGLRLECFSTRNTMLVLESKRAYMCRVAPK